MDERIDREAPAMTADQSLDGPVLSADVLVDGEPQTYERLAALHDGARVITSDHGVELTRYDDIAAATKRRDVHSMEPHTAVAIANALGAGRPLIPLMLDGDEHTKYRKLLDPYFAPRRIAGLEPVVRDLAESLIDGFAADGAVELYEAFCEPLPSQMFLRLLGLPIEDAPFLMWVKDGPIRPVDEEHRATAGPKLLEYL